MKITLIKNADGRVIATFERAEAGRPSIHPALKPGHTIHEVEVDENYREKLRSLYEHHSHR